MLKNPKTGSHHGVPESKKGRVRQGRTWGEGEAGQGTTKNVVLILPNLVFVVCICLRTSFHISDLIHELSSSFTTITTLLYQTMHHFLKVYM